MKILILGSGAREHAIALAISSTGGHTVTVAPGNAGIEGEFECVPCAINKASEVIKLARQKSADLVVIGPEDPLVRGVADELRAAGIDVFGPSKAAANLEGSKIFSKEFLQRANVKTAAFTIVKSKAETMTAANQYTSPYVLKADGLCAGKGVHILKTKRELETSAKQFFEDRIFGAAGEQAVLEQFTPGTELSYLILTNGSESQTLPLAKDHKRLKDNDEGPNTGGMGAIAPAVTEKNLKENIENKIVKPVLEQLKKEKLFYRGVLYIGLMLTSDGPSVIEFNCRFGDPEAQVILPLVQGDIGKIFQEIAKGNVPELKQTEGATCTVVAAAPNYPNQPEKGIELKIEKKEKDPNKYFLFAGVQKNKEGHLETAGGRVACATAKAESLPKAIEAAYEKLKELQFKGMQYRRDIGK